MVASEFRTSVLPVSRKLLKYASQFLKDGEEARDVVQDVFLKLWKMREELPGIGNIEAFAVRMTRNRCLDVMRAKRTDEMKGKALKPDITWTEDVHTRIELSEAANQIRSIIGTLPEMQRKLMQLRDIEQFTLEEIEEITGMNANTIRVNLSRARKKVRDEFIKSDDNEYKGYKKSADPVFRGQHNR